MKSPRELEKIFKGAANHWRIKILELIGKSEGIAFMTICEQLDGNYKTLSEHIRKLTNAGLVEKKYFGKMVLHTLTAKGKKLLNILKTF